jgi:hypothetical protein
MRLCPFDKLRVSGGEIRLRVSVTVAAFILRSLLQLSTSISVGEFETFSFARLYRMNLYASDRAAKLFQICP